MYNRDKRNMCGRKQSHESMGKAKAHARESSANCSEHKGNTCQEAYLCPFCSNYHVGHALNSMKQKERLRNA